ncbi:TlpA family protein disulfide reductase [Gracilimonas mengyeensis]|uniref:TlpA family protein disulfide reductase n=1 Tax=Gracilimonas mengyeensis TaxID=1302730 RepID=UPI00163D4804|nr:thioredoxin family protein [Gracilimonas mengyeensis]
MAAQSSAQLIGEVTKEQILKSDRIYEIYFNRYQPENEAVEYLQALQDSISIYVFWGSWCPESKKQVPRLIKTLDRAGNENINAHYIGTDAQKKFPKEFLKKFDIKYIPTVMVLKSQLEVGRIDQKPNIPIEKALIQVLKKDNSN